MATFKLHQHHDYGDLVQESTFDCQGDAAEELRVRVARLRDTGTPHTVDGMTVTIDYRDPGRSNPSVVTLRYEVMS